MAKTVEDARLKLLSDSSSDRKVGVDIIEKLARDGNAEAIYALATWYLHGSNGYEHDKDKGIQLLNRAADKLWPSAIYDLAFSEEEKSGRDRKRNAFGLYVVAAILGDNSAKEEVLRCLYWGQGSFKNPRAANLLQNVLELEK